MWPKLPKSLDNVESFIFIKFLVISSIFKFFIVFLGSVSMILMDIFLGHLEVSIDLYSNHWLEGP